MKKLKKNQRNLKKSQRKKEKRRQNQKTQYHQKRKSKNQKRRQKKTRFILIDVNSVRSLCCSLDPASQVHDRLVLLPMDHIYQSAFRLEQLTALLHLTFQKN